MRSWIALFSHTGSEIFDVCQSIRKWPDLIITNNRNFNQSSWINAPKLNILYANKPMTPEMYRWCFASPHSPLVTCHGWMRIIPESICNEFECINLHPGLISKYPELKGKDPQEKAVLLNLPTTGCTIHRMTKDLDGGEILKEREINIEGKSKGQVITDLRILAKEMWINYLSIL